MKSLLFMIASGYNRLLVGLNYISVVIIFLTALWITGDVLGRVLFRSPIPGTTELVQVGILAIVFFGVGYTLQQGRHIRTEILVRRLPPAVVQLCTALGCVIGVVTFSLVCVFGWEQAWQAWIVQEFEGVQLQVPTWPSRFIMVLGSGLLVIQYVIDLVKAISELMSRIGEKNSCPKA